MFTLTYSNTKTFRDCPYKFYLMYLEGLRPIAKSDSLLLGSAFHEGVEKGEVGIDAYFAERPPRTQEEADLQRILEVTAKCMLSLVPEEKEAIHEVEWDMPLINPDTGCPSRTFNVAGKIDTLVPPKKMFIERKTRGQSPQKSDIDRLPLDAQVLTYANALEYLEVPMNRVSYQYYMKPGIKRHGSTPSKAATPRPKELEPVEEYCDRIRHYYVDNADRLFRQEVLTIPQESLQRYREDLWRVGQGILWFRSHGCWYRNSSHCSDYGGCAMLPLCRGENVEGLYRQGEPNEELGKDKRNGFTAD